jgi:branched-subunit amino acid aminotransferase/4-amino-4-deoxychorismate lyase
LVLGIAQGLVFSPIAANIKAVTQIQECFITSVSRGILPVVKIDEVMIGNGTPGPITQQLIQRLAVLIAQEAKPV